MDKEVDIYRDTPVRLLGYANEVGESFRALVHVNVVRLSYGISTLYALADTYDKARKSYKVRRKGAHLNPRLLVFNGVVYLGRYMTPCALLHIWIQSIQFQVETIRKSEEYRTEEDRRKAVFAASADTIIWQTFASVLIPGLAINRICAFSGYVLKQATKFRPITIGWLTVAVGISSIPIIYKPIDHLVDDIMDVTVRKVLPTSFKVTKP